MSPPSWRRRGAARDQAVESQGPQGPQGRESQSRRCPWCPCCPLGPCSFLLSRSQRLLLPPSLSAVRVVLPLPDGDLGLQALQGRAARLVGGGAVGGADGDDDARLAHRP